MDPPEGYNHEKKRGREPQHPAPNKNDGESENSTCKAAATTAADPSFMASMTFAASGGASAVRGGCDCDECGGNAGLFTPQAIVDAIRAHKRMRKEYMPMKRTQQRELVQRQGQISVYKWTMPRDADPLVEFGTAHRLIWIQTLSNSSVLKTIGKGILGSQDEEKGRRDLPLWKQGDVYLVPSNGGKAVAWIHSKLSEPTKEGDDDESVSKSPVTTTKDKHDGNKPAVTDGGHAIVYICKIPQESLLENTTLESGNDKETQQEWHHIVRSICRRGLDAFENENTEKGSSLQFQKVAEASSVQLREALSSSL